MTSVPAEERTTKFRKKLYNDAVQNDKRTKVTCVGKTIHKLSRGSSSSGIRQTSQESEELKEQLQSLKEEKEEFKQMKEDMKQEREELLLKMDQLNELIATYGVPQPSPRIASCSANVVSQQVPDASSTGRQVRLAPVLAPQFPRKDSAKVELLCDGIRKQVVVEGIVVSKDPQEKVANLPLGLDHWKIFLEKAKCPTYLLSGSVDDGDAFTVAQAVNTFLVWPKVNVSEK